MLPVQYMDSCVLVFWELRHCQRLCAIFDLFCRAETHLSEKCMVGVTAPHMTQTVNFEIQVDLFREKEVETFDR
jgi:hypothetical protein